MALEDRIEKLTAAIEKLIDGLAARPIAASLVHDVVSEKPAAVLLEPETPKPARGRPRKQTPLEPVNTAPPSVEVKREDDDTDEQYESRKELVGLLLDPPPVDEEDPAQEVAMAAVEPETVEPETVAPAIVAVPPAPAVTEDEAREAMLNLHKAFGKEPAKAILSSFGLERLAEIRGKSDVWAPMHAAALARIAELSDDGI